MSKRAENEILLVEDSPRDIELFRLALSESDLDGVLRTAPSGEKALEILEEESMDIIILDINLPGKQGLEILEELRSKTSSRATPVLIFSSSDDPDEIRESYELGANAYIVKRMDFGETVELVEALDHFWLHTAELPS